MTDAVQNTPLQAVLQKRRTISLQSLIAFVPVAISLVLTPLPLALRLLLILALAVAIALLLYSRNRSRLRTLEQSIEPVPVEDSCAKHTLLPALFVETNRKYQHDLIDRDAPAIVKVGDVRKRFQSHHRECSLTERRRSESSLRKSRQRKRNNQKLPKRRRKRFQISSRFRLPWNRSWRGEWRRFARSPSRFPPPSAPTWFG